MTELKKYCRRVPFSPAASLTDSSGNQIYRQISLPTKNGTIFGGRASAPRKACGSRTKRAAFCSASKASMTIEAAIAVPIFLMTVICLISMIRVYGIALDRAAALRDTAAAAAAADGAGEDEDLIDLNIPFLFTPYFLPERVGSALIPCRAVVRAWNGRDPGTTAEGSGSSDRFVYVTDHQSVYHTRAGCTHLDLSVRSVPAGSLGFLHNEYGGRYHACEKCCGNGNGSTVYITSYGDCYHSSPECGALTRNVRLVSEQELEEGLCVCSRCAAA